MEACAAPCRSKAAASSRQAFISAYEFVNSVGWQWHHLSVEIPHISNGRLHLPNRGETMALVGVGCDIQ